MTKQYATIRIVLKSNIQGERGEGVTLMARQIQGVPTFIHLSSRNVDAKKYVNIDRDEVILSSEFKNVHVP